MIQETITKIKQSKSLHHLQQIHAQTITKNFISPNPNFITTNVLHIFTSLLTTTTTTTNSSSFFPLVNYANTLFRTIKNPSTFCYNNLIRTHTLLSSPSSAFHVFVGMRRLSVSPDSHTFPFMIRASGFLPNVVAAQTLHSESVKFGFLVDLYLVNNLIRVYAVFERINDAQQVFDESFVKDVVSYNVLIDGFVKNRAIEKARKVFDVMPVRDNVSWATILAGYAGRNDIDCGKETIVLFNQMIGLAIRPDNVSLVATLSACAQLGELDEGRRIHDYIKHKGTRLDSFLSTSLVDFYAKCGLIEIAMEIFESSPVKSLCTWNAMLIGFAIHGYSQQALVYFNKMINFGIKPDGVSFLGVLVACSHGGLVTEARRFFNEMESIYNIPRELKHYGCMADLLARAGLINEAIEMINEMPMGGDVFVWGGLLGGCKLHGDVEIAMKAAEQVMELKPEDGGVYSMMASVYADAKKWDEVVKVREVMDMKKVKKRQKNGAGCSLIQLNGITHQFVAGETCFHPQADEIYFMLDRIGKNQI